VDALWPARTAVVGLYDHEPPPGSGITARAITRDDLPSAFAPDSVIRTAELLTRAKDYIGSLLP
jgi:hypothetical protein